MNGDLPTVNLNLAWDIFLIVDSIFFSSYYLYAYGILIINERTVLYEL